MTLIFKKICHCTLIGSSKFLTILFALFCIFSGLISQANALTVSGTVRDGVTGTNIKNIRVIYAEMNSICPVYGLPASGTCKNVVIHDSLPDTEVTKSDGAFSFDVLPPKYGTPHLLLQDIDSTQNGAYRPDTIEIPQNINKIEVNLVPVNFEYTIKGKVLSKKDNTPLYNIRVALQQDFSHPPIVTLYTITRDTTYTDRSGNFSFKIKNKENNLRIKVTDIDERKNGGIYIQDSTALFKVNSVDPTIHTISMTPEPPSSADDNHIANNLTKKSMLVTQSNNSVIIKNMQTGQISSVSIIDAHGKTIVSPVSLSSNQIVWDTRAVSRGVYLIRVVSATATHTTKVMIR